MDNKTKAERSANMRAIRSKDTAPELMVRKLLFAEGFRYRLHVKSLPGKPDIVLPKWKTVIFVNGCFWHVHQNCKRAVKPRSNTAYWEEKLRRNQERDRNEYDLLKKGGWRVLVIWECACCKKFQLKLQLYMKQFLLMPNREQYKDIGLEEIYKY